MLQTSYCKRNPKPIVHLNSQGRRYPQSRAIHSPSRFPMAPQTPGWVRFLIYSTQTHNRTPYKVMISRDERGECGSSVLVTGAQKAAVFSISPGADISPPQSAHIDPLNKSMLTKRWSVLISFQSVTGWRITYGRCVVLLTDSAQSPRTTRSTREDASLMPVRPPVI